MFFTPHIKRKKGPNSKWLLNPFPNIQTNEKYKGIFTGICVEIYTKEDIIAIYDNGFFGKGSQSRSTPQVVMQNVDVSNSKQGIEETLILGLEEAFFLAYYLDVLNILDLTGELMDYRTFLEECLKVNVMFIESLSSYLYLKSKGWIVKSGLKFGGNYLIYRKGPRFYHASFVVIVKTPVDIEHLDSKNLKGLQRIAETSDKDVLILEVCKPNDFQLVNIGSLSNIEISEMIVRRFNSTAFVQNQNTTK